MDAGWTSQIDNYSLGQTQDGVDLSAPGSLSSSTHSPGIYLKRCDWQRLNGVVEDQLEEH